jgi:hypothetical protein
MRALTIVMLASLGAAAPAFAEDGAELSSADRAGVQQTILGQIDAFKHDDANGAFAFAAPGTQRRFGDPNVFLDMVRNAYQPVYNPHGIDFTKLSTQDGAIVQSVELIGPDGAAYTALYTMEREADGSWRIIACMLVPSQRVGA